MRFQCFIFQNFLLLGINIFFVLFGFHIKAICFGNKNRMNLGNQRKVPQSSSSLHDLYVKNELALLKTHTASYKKHDFIFPARMRFGCRVSFIISIFFILILNQ